MQSHGPGYIEILNPDSISESFKTEYYSAIVSYAIRSWITFIYEYLRKLNGLDELINWKTRSLPVSDDTTCKIFLFIYMSLILKIVLLIVTIWLLGVLD